MSLNPGQVIDEKYQILRLLGTGGMGAVYEGENVRIKRRVAIKVLHASVSSAADNVARFEREAQAAGRIGSEHICEVLDLGVLADGSRYMVMEYLDGETLSHRIKKNGRLTPAQSIPLMAQVLDALGAAHAAGIVHRDLKPDNIFILPSKAGRTDFIKILDFGVSKFSQISGEEFNVTRAGAVVGTPYYMSPEQARGMAQVDARSDIYALGVVLYQATTGQVPFRAETFNELLFKIALELPPPPQQFVPDLDSDFSAIIQRAMAREQAHRFQSCAEFKEALLAWQNAHLAPGFRIQRSSARLAKRTPCAGVCSSKPHGSTASHASAGDAASVGANSSSGRNSRRRSSFDSRTNLRCRRRIFRHRKLMGQRIRSRASARSDFVTFRSAHRCARHGRDAYGSRSGRLFRVRTQRFRSDEHAGRFGDKPRCDKPAGHERTRSRATSCVRCGSSPSRTFRRHVRA